MVFRLFYCLEKDRRGQIINPIESHRRLCARLEEARRPSMPKSQFEVTVAHHTRSGQAADGHTPTNTVPYLFITSSSWPDSAYICHRSGDQQWGMCTRVSRDWIDDALVTTTVPPPPEASHRVFVKQTELKILGTVYKVGDFDISVCRITEMVRGGAEQVKGFSLGIGLPACRDPGASAALAEYFDLLLTDRDAVLWLPVPLHEGGGQEARGVARHSEGASEMLEAISYAALFRLVVKAGQQQQPSLPPQHQQQQLQQMQQQADQNKRQKIYN